MSDFFQLVEQRESCRNYDPQKRPTKEQLVRCIQVAQLSPSACNSQPWSFLVINSPEKPLSLPLLPSAPASTNSPTTVLPLLQSVRRMPT